MGYYHQGFTLLVSGFDRIQVYGFLEDITSPVEEPIRRVISRFNTGTIDFTPLVAILLLGFIKRMIYMFL